MKDDDIWASQFFCVNYKLVSRIFLIITLHKRHVNTMWDEDEVNTVT